MNEMADRKVRTVYYSEEFKRFFDDLDTRVREKYLWTIQITETVQVLPTKYVKKLEGTEFYEMRVSVGYNEYRTVLFAIDSDNFVKATEIYQLFEKVHQGLQKTNRDCQKDNEGGRIMRVDPEKLKKNFRPAEELMTEYVGPAGSPEREEMETKAKAWFYGEILRERRRELKMSQAALAEKVGAKQSYIARLEKGEVDVQFSSLLKIAGALGLNVQLQ